VLDPFNFDADYDAHVIWRAPRRALLWRGRAQVEAMLLRQSAAMLEPRVTWLRQVHDAGRQIDEFVVRFVHAGGIENLSCVAGSEVELECLRVRHLRGSTIQGETCFETWTLLRAP
jgi:hypothetical protein